LLKAADENPEDAENGAHKNRRKIVEIRQGSFQEKGKHCK